MTDSCLQSAPHDLALSSHSRLAIALATSREKKSFKTGSRIRAPSVPACGRALWTHLRSAHRQAWGAAQMAWDFETDPEYQAELDWVADFVRFKKDRVAKAVAALKQSRATKVRSQPSLPLSGYAGAYADAWYGPIDIRENGGRLRIDFKQTPNMQGTLEHWQYDTFVTRWDDRTIEPAYVTFALDAKGAIDRITMKKQSPTRELVSTTPRRTSPCSTSTRG